MKNIESNVNRTKRRGEDRKRFSLTMLAKSAAAVILLLVIATGCDTTSSKNTFELETYLGAPYTGTVEASFLTPGQQLQKQNHQGEIRIQDLTGGQARMNIILKEVRFSFSRVPMMKMAGLFLPPASVISMSM